MKNLLLLTLLIFSNVSVASISIVSDLDDTIKLSVSDGDYTDYLGDDVFSGVTEFFLATKPYTRDLYILSASPTAMRMRIAGVLRKNQISYKKMILRENIFEDKFQYKVRKIKKILDSSKDEFILIGDDLGEDPEAYAEIKRLYPERILDIYIHVVNGRQLNEEVIPYWTTFDLFMREFSAGRMSSDWIEFGWEKLMGEINFKLIFPKEADCPTNPEVWEWQMTTVFQPEAAALADRFQAFCLQRQSDNFLP